jgi:uncharacterized protein
MSSMISFILEKNQKKSIKKEMEFQGDGVNAKGIVYVELENADYGIDISIQLDAEVFLTCSRCAEDFTEHQIIDHKIILAKTDNGLELDNETEEMNVINMVQSTLDLHELLRQLLIEKQTMRPLCDEDCKGLCPICGTNLNYETCNCQEEQVDPRWAKLKSLDISKEEV